MSLENLKVPQFDALQHPDLLKPAILNAHRSAALGFWLVLTPAFFIACIAMKYWVGWRLGLFQNFEQFWARLDQDRLGFWLQPLVFIFAPAATVALNLLAVLHVRYDRTRRELHLTLKLRPLNLLLVVAGLAILGIFTLYAIGEFFHHEASGRS